MARNDNRRIAVRPVAALGAAGDNSASYVNRAHRGVEVTVKHTAASGTNPTLTVKLQRHVPGAGWVDVAGATTTALAGGTPATTTLLVYPGCSASANAVVDHPLPPVWRLNYAVGGTSTPTVTFSVDAELLV